jgi:hypothetical protein
LKHSFGVISAVHQQNRDIFSLSAVTFFVCNAQLSNGTENTASVVVAKLPSSKNPHALPCRNQTNNPKDAKRPSKIISLSLKNSQSIRQ